MINHLITWFWRKRFQQIIPQIDLTPADKQAIAHFFRSSSGQMLILCLQKIAIQMNATAVCKGTPYECGRAAGYQLVFHDITQLSQATADSGNPEESANQGAADLLERYSP